MTERPQHAVLTIHGSDNLRGYPYYWIKAVKGFNGENHCARCLVGPFVHVRADAWPMNRPVALDLKGAKYGYICGVSDEGYAKNLHLPFLPEAGARVEMKLVKGQTIVLEGGRLLPIPGLPDRWCNLPRAFTTCRNFQFGVAYFNGQHQMKQRRLGEL